MSQTHSKLAESEKRPKSTADQLDNAPPRDRALAPIRLSPPRLRRDTISRTSLIERLERGLSRHRLAFVVAPIGSGKTTLLAEFASQTQDADVCWLGLVKGVDASAFTQALQVALGDRELDESLVLKRQLIIVIDDLHLADEAELLPVLKDLIDNLPEAARLVLSSRTPPALPIHRYRARRDLLEIGLSDLEFSSKDVEDLAVSFFAQEPTPPQAECIRRRSQGWPAGVSLLLAPEPHRRGDSDLFEFVNAEVLSHHSEEEIDFLLKTSVLHDLTPTSCASLLESNTDDGLLAKLVRTNGFITLDDPIEPTYRVHDLLRDHLRSRLRTDEPTEWIRLNRRAATLEPDSTRVIELLLDGESWSEAAERIDLFARDMMFRGEGEDLRVYIERLPTEVQEQSPTLIMHLASCAVQSWQYEAGKRLLARTVQLAESGGHQPLIDEARALQASIDWSQSTERALTPELSDLCRLQMLLARAWRGTLCAEVEGPLQDLDAALDILEANDDQTLLLETAFTFQSGLLRLPGGTDRGGRFCRIARTRLRGDEGPLFAALLKMEGYTLIHRGLLQDGIQRLEEALDLSRSVGSPRWVTCDILVVLPLCHAVLQNHEEAATYSSRLLKFTNRDKLRDFIRPWFATCRYTAGRVALASGDLEGASAQLTRMEVERGDHEWLGCSIYRATLRAYIDLENNRPEAAIAHLEPMIPEQERHPISATAGDVQTLLAFALLSANQPEQAMALFLPRLRLFHKENILGLLMLLGESVLVPLLEQAQGLGECLDEVEELFRLCPLSPNHQRSTKIEVTPMEASGLSVRELEVLALVASGASNQDIAEELALSIHTVKRHVANVLAKLDVESRTKAANVARSKGLILS